DSAAALEKADKALALNAEQALALDMRYQALRALDREEEADAARELLVAASPKSGAVALLRDGVAQFQAGETEAAITLLEQSLVADPELYHSHFNLGMAYANLDERAKAAEQFQAFLDKAPADDSNRES